ncbi:MAG: archaeal proteasome endopeptidase complex subunit beta [Candidatus Altiarchaeota archaeon]|nr:archaeal proteasome endopeptidase complex subunit beta [Candidatus Altiarchaeota archaeon]
MESKVFEGTTTVGLVCKDGVVLATDKRASWGGFIASKNARKSFNINDLVGATVAGSVGDAESLMRLIQAEARLYEMNNGEKMSTNAISILMANILHGNKIFPYLVQLLIGGYTNEEAKLWSLDPIGGLIEEEAAATGSGSPMAYGLMDLEYKKENSVEENIPIALRAISAAISRDSHTGDGIGLATITKDGFKQYSDEEIKTLTEKSLKK